MNPLKFIHLALERPDKESLSWEMCYMEVFMIVDVLTHDPLIEI